MNRFYIGEEVIALPEANDRYIVTREGWVGTVVGLLDTNMIQVKGIGDKTTYPVLCKCFTPLHSFPQDAVLSYEERV
jgi:hypothetical protein